MTSWNVAVLQTAPHAPTVFLLGFSAVLAVAAIGASLFAVWRAQVLVIWADERERASLEECQAAIAALQKALDGLTAELQDLRQQGPASVPSVPRAGLNLCKRSQVLRMHRKGDALERIAAVLEVPLQEVDLLLKVHRLIVRNL